MVVTLLRALDEVRDAPFLLDAIRAADGVAWEARAARGDEAIAALVKAALDPRDQITAIAAVHGLGHALDDGADAALSRLLSHERRFIREHAAWALAARPPRLDAIGRLVEVLAGDAFPAMVAQRTLERWSQSIPDHVALAVEGAYRMSTDPAIRERLVETLGLVPGPLAQGMVDRVAVDSDEKASVRAAAVAAIGDRADTAAGALLMSLDVSGDPVLDFADFRAVLRLALFDASTPIVVDRPTAQAAPSAPGLAVAQMFLHADLDRQLTRAGAGDNGGIATLIVRLGDALVRGDNVARILTISRGTNESVCADLLDSAGEGEGEGEGEGKGEGHHDHRLAHIALPPWATGIAESWPARVAVERGLRRLLRHGGPVDAFHVRMADVGAMAAQTVCREMGIPLVFSLAPDPHVVVHALDMTDALRRDNFGDFDEHDHYWFRIRLVHRLSEDAARLVLFPRAELRDDLMELVGVDIRDRPARFAIVPEGIDIGVSATARVSVAAGRDPAIDDLEALIGKLPGERHGLPLAISVGRLHRVKGMATVVEAWASDPDVQRRCNLVIVGGDLDHPSTAETEQLARIRSVVASHPGAADGLVLAGHRPNDVVARWLAATYLGTGGRVGPAGVYVCGSLKEEFGIALLEAMAAGLVVVAPHEGGPATFVEPGITGVLIDTRSPQEVAIGIAATLDMSQRPGSGERATAVVRRRFTIDTMADRLASVYRSVTLPLQTDTTSSVQAAVSTVVPTEVDR